MTRGFRRGAIVAFAILVPIAAWTVWDFVEAARLARLIRMINEKGEPIAPHELPPLPLPLTEEQKLASRYYLAAAMLASDLEQGNLTPEVLKGHGDALALLDRGTQLEFRSLNPGTEFSYRTAGFLQLARLNSIRADSLARAGNGDAAASALIASIRLRRVMESLFPPLAWSFIDREDSLRTLGATLANSTLSAEALHRVQETLEQALRPTAMEDRIVALRGQAIHRFWTEYYGGTVMPAVRGTPARVSWIEWIARPWRANRFMAALVVANRRLEAARVPWPGKLEAVEAQRRKREAERPPAAGAPSPRGRRETNIRWWLDHPIVDLGEPSAAYRVAVRLASDRAAVAALAIERFRRAHAGGLPDALPALSPEFLTSILEDPFSGRPLLYRRDQTGYVVYSVGANRSDDSGAVEPDGGDVGLRVSAGQR